MKLVLFVMGIQCIVMEPIIPLDWLSIIEHTNHNVHLIRLI